MTKSQNGIKSICSPPSNILLEYKNHFWSRKSSSEIPARHGTTSISSLQIGRYSISNSIESTIRKYNTTVLQKHIIIFFTNRKSGRTRNASYKSWNDWESKTKYNQDYHCPSWSIFSLLDTLLRYMYLVRSSISLKRVSGVHWKVSKTIIYLIRIVLVQQRSFISSFMNAKCVVLRIRSMKVVKSSE